MKQLIRGLTGLGGELPVAVREALQSLSSSQAPDLLLFACSDSRVMPHLFTSAEPGDVFAVRTVGNVVAPAQGDGNSALDASEAAAIEYAVEVLGVRHLAVCGHSNCGAVAAVAKGLGALPASVPHVARWLQFATGARAVLDGHPELGVGLPEVERLAQANVLLQLQHVASYAPVKSRRASGEVTLHGLFLDLSSATVSLYEEEVRRFVPLDEAEVVRLVRR